MIEFLKETGFYLFSEGNNWQCLIMIAIACVLCYLAIGKKFEPLLLLPIAVGMLLTNLPGAGMFHEELFAGGHINWALFGGADVTKEMVVEVAVDMGVFDPKHDTIKALLEAVKANLPENTEATVSMLIEGYKNSAGEFVKPADNIFNVLYEHLNNAELFAPNPALAKLNAHLIAGEGISVGLLDVLYLGVKLGIYPCLIFIGVGAMTDFGPLLANPKSLLLGAAAQIGIFATVAGVMGVSELGKAVGWNDIVFSIQEAASIGIIGGADGPTAIFVTSHMAPQLLGPIAVAAYSYMALVPVIQPPIMKLLTTKKEREIKMPSLRPVSKTAKIVFPIVVTAFVTLLVPSAGALIGCLMFGNLLKECGVCDRLSKTVQNELMNIVTVFLGISVGATATAATFLSPKTLIIIVMGVIAFSVATAGGVLVAKLMNLFLPEGKKINPLIGSAGVSAVPMAARVSQKVGQEANPGNFLLMHAMGPNVAGVIGSAIAAGVLISLVG